MKISHKEKLEFYKKYNSKEFQEKLKNIDKVTSKLFISTIATLPLTSLVLGFINPWLFLGLIPALAIPFSVSTYETHKRNKLIKELNENFTIDTVYEMIENGEWKLLGYELSAQEMCNHHYAENKKLIIEENMPNTYIIKEDTPTEENLLKKTKQRNKNEKFENIPRSLNCCIIKESEPIACYMVKGFLETFRNITLLEFTQSEESPEIYFALLKNKNNEFLEFVVSETRFIGINSGYGLDLSENWQQYLNKNNNYKKPSKEY